MEKVSNSQTLCTLFDNSYLHFFESMQKYNQLHKPYVFRFRMLSFHSHSVLYMYFNVSNNVMEYLVENNDEEYAKCKGREKDIIALTLRWLTTGDLGGANVVGPKLWGKFKSFRKGSGPGYASALSCFNEVIKPIEEAKNNFESRKLQAQRFAKGESDQLDDTSLSQVSLQGLEDSLSQVVTVFQN